MTIDELRLNNWRDEYGNLWNPPNSKDWIIYNKEDTILSYGTGSTKRLIPGWFIGLPYDIEKVRNIRGFLNNYGRTLEEYAARFLYNLSEVPKCENPSCNNKVSIYKLHLNFNSYCCFDCQFADGTPHNEALSISISETWNDPDSGYNQPQWHELRSEAARKLWLNQDMQEYLRDRREILGINKRHSELMKEYWNDQTSVFNSDEYREKLSKARSEVWNYPNSPYRTNEWINNALSNLNSTSAKAKAGYYQFLSLGDREDICELYIGIKFNEYIKFGVSFGLYKQKLWRCNLDTVHKVIVGPRELIARYEAEIKLLINNANEFLPIEYLPIIFNAIRHIRSNGFQLTDWN